MVTRKPALALSELILGNPRLVLQGIELIKVDTLDDLVVLPEVLLGHGEATEKGQDDEPGHPQRGSDVVFLR